MPEVSPIDELKILYRYHGSLNVPRLYARMEELAEQLGYGREYWHAVFAEEKLSQDLAKDYENLLAYTKVLEKDLNPPHGIH